MRSILESLLVIGFYNGLEEEIKEISSYIRENSTITNSAIIQFPSFLKEYDCNHYLRVLWSVLVLEYGDYGTSPRFGWLESASVKELPYEIDKWLNQYDNTD